jgi:hypothetical protein
MKIITHAGEPPSTKIGQIRARPKALLQLSARIALGLALAISSAQQRIAEVISHTAILPRQPAFHMDSFRAVLGSEEWRIPSICALIQIKHPTGRRRVHCGRRQRPPVRLWKSDAMGVRAIDRGVKGCIYLNGTQRAENERATVSRDLTEMPGVDVRASAPTRLKSYQIRRELRAGAANFSAPGLKRQDNDLIAIKSAESAPRRPRHSSAISRPDLAATKFYPPA